MARMDSQCSGSAQSSCDSDEPKCGSAQALAAAGVENLLQRLQQAALSACASGRAGPKAMAMAMPSPPACGQTAEAAVSPDYRNALVLASYMALLRGLHETALGSASAPAAAAADAAASHCSGVADESAESEKEEEMVAAAAEMDEKCDVTSFKTETGTATPNAKEAGDGEGGGELSPDDPQVKSTCSTTQSSNERPAAATNSLTSANTGSMGAARAYNIDALLADTRTAPPLKTEPSIDSPAGDTSPSEHLIAHGTSTGRSFEEPLDLSSSSNKCIRAVTVLGEQQTTCASGGLGVVIGGQAPAGSPWNAATDSDSALPPSAKRARPHPQPSLVARAFGAARLGGRERYACRFCGKFFPRSANLTRHIRVHTGIAIDIDSLLLGTRLRDVLGSSRVESSRV